jgi:hypothetical protein
MELNVILELEIFIHLNIKNKVKIYKHRIFKYILNFS